MIMQKSVGLDGEMCSFFASNAASILPCRTKNIVMTFDLFFASWTFSLKFEFDFQSQFLVAS